MQEAVKVGEGAMAAVVGLSCEKLAEVCRAAAGKGVVEPANFNGGDQIVISGNSAAVSAACESAKSAGAKRALPLPVSAPFHCSLMRPAALRLAPELRAIPQGPFRFPVVANVTAEPYPADVSGAELLIRQIAAPVRWEECVKKMSRMGVTTFLEVGPGKVLSGLLRRIVREASSAAFCSPADLLAVRGILA